MPPLLRSRVPQVSSGAGRLGHGPDAPTSGDDVRSIRRRLGDGHVTEPVLHVPSFMDDVTVDGKSYKVLHRFSETRAIVDFDGEKVLVDMTDGEWDLSGRPATDEEGPVLKGLVGQDGTTVAVTGGVAPV